MWTVSISCFLLLFVTLITSQVPCQNSKLCKRSTSRCCESSNGTQWCCPTLKHCCNTPDGCCSIDLNDISDKLIDAKEPQKEISFKSAGSKKMFLPSVSTEETVTINSLQDYKQCEKEGLFYCPTKETCCESSSGLWKCCQYQNGTCCKDKENCCPAKLSCNGTRCSRLKPVFQFQSGPAIFCPGRRQICPVTFTCCLNGNDSYGCCPYENAVCCSDLVHCCPPNTQCNILEKSCLPPPSV